MAKLKKKDEYTQLMNLAITMSAANTLSFSALALGVSLFDYVGVLISRIEYHPALGTLGEMTATADYATFALTGDDGISDLDTAKPEVYDALTVSRLDMGSTPADKLVLMTPIIHDFSTLKGGGILVPAQEMYIGMISSGLASAGNGKIRVYYTFIELNASEYLELAQRLRVLST